MADYVSALRQVAETRPYMDLTRVGVSGWSLGGFTAVRAILSAPDVYHVAVANNGISEMASNINGFLLQSREAAEKGSNLRLAENLEGKLLLIHCTDSTVHPLGHTMRMVDSLIEANKQFDLLIMPGEGMLGERIIGTAGYGVEAALRYFKEHLNP